MATFRADCNGCCGLCCVVPDFFAAQGFGVDKPAETACANLDGFHRCAIHATRQTHGYTACGGFDCFGAGQWITQTLFKGAHWNDSPGLARLMFAAYRHWLPQFEAAALIEAALPYVREDTKSALISTMTALTSVDSTGQLQPTDASQLRRETLEMIRAALRTMEDG